MKQFYAPACVKDARERRDVRHQEWKREIYPSSCSEAMQLPCCSFPSVRVNAYAVPPPTTSSHCPPRTEHSPPTRGSMADPWGEERKASRCILWITVDSVFKNRCLNRWVSPWTKCHPFIPETKSRAQIWIWTFEHVLPIMWKYRVCWGGGMIWPLPMLKPNLHPWRIPKYKNAK